MTWATKNRAKPARMVIKDLSKKWASGVPDGVVTFAQALVETPEDFQDDVFVHELLHLRYRSQGKSFAAIMTALVPGWRECEASSPTREVRR